MVRCRPLPDTPEPSLLSFSYAVVMRDLPRSRAGVEQAAELAGPDATVQEIRAPHRGAHAHTYLIRTANPELEFILREFPPGDEAVGNESHVLSALGGLDGLAPRLLASGADGALSEWSWTLISRLPGSADISPGLPFAWPDGLAKRSHASTRRPSTPLPDFQHVSERPRGSLATVSGPAAAVVAASWELLARADCADALRFLVRQHLVEGWCAHRCRGLVWRRVSPFCLICSCTTCGP